jgi:hypothetical protein
MILFTAQMAEAILAGRKTVTRRRWKRPRVKVGSIQQCYTRPPFARPPGKAFARVRILSVHIECRPGDFVALTMRAGDDRRCQYAVESYEEGFDSWHQFGEAYIAINGAAALEEPCYRVEFVLCDPCPTSSRVRGCGGAG